MSERVSVSADHGPEVADRIHDAARRERLRTAHNPNRAFDYIVGTSKNSSFSGVVDLESG